MTSHKKMITYLWNFLFGFYIVYNIWSFWINTSHFEIDAWNFLIFQFDEQVLGFWVSYIFNTSRFSFFLVKY